MRRVDGNLRVAGPTHAELRLAREADGRRLLRGHFESTLEARCQRCLEWMTLGLDGEIEVEVVEAGNAPSLDDHVLAVDGKLDLIALIEDELLLACPMIPLHAARDCAGAAAGEAEPAPEEQRHKPFAALAEMMNTNRDDH